MTLNSWRPQRDEEGWKNSNKRKRETGKDAPPSSSVGILEPPEWTKEVPRLRSDIGALMELTLSVLPPQIPIQPTNKDATYVVGDASGLGFGSVSWSRKDKKIRAMVGVWNNKTRDNSSSNFQEAANLVRRLKIMLEEERLEQGSEVFIFTDNSTFERTYHRGSSTSKLLHKVILELRKIEMSGKLILHVI